jgi:hypothetical protein
MILVVFLMVSTVKKLVLVTGIFGALLAIFFPRG